MKDKIKEIFQKVTDYIFELDKKLDKISEEIKERTGVKINIGLILIGTVLFIFLCIIVKSVLGFLWGQL